MGKLSPAGRHDNCSPTSVIEEKAAQSGEERAMKTTYFLATTILAGVLAGVTVLAGPVLADAHPSGRPGTLNYVEGKAFVGTKSLDAKSIGTVEVDPGETLSTENGKVEILLTPGVFFRLGQQSSATMISSGLTDTRVSLDQGEALVEVAEIHPENDLRVQEDGKTTELLKAGLYDFNQNQGLVRVLDGEAMLEDGPRNVKIKSGHMVDLGTDGTVRAKKFDKKELEAEDLYRWTSLRSSYLAEANADYAPNYSYGGFGWYGDGWYWDPWFDAFTFIPGDGVFCSPFGWGFYSPWYAYGAPFYGSGHYYHHFNTSYQAFAAGSHYGLPANYGHGVHYGPRYGLAGIAGRTRSGSVRASGFHGGGFHGGGFHGGGFSGGGFHGGGGGGHR